MLQGQRSGPTSFAEVVTWRTRTSMYKGENTECKYLKRTGGVEKHGQAPRGPAARGLIAPDGVAGGRLLGLRDGDGGVLFTRCSALRARGG